MVVVASWVGEGVGGVIEWSNVLLGIRYIKQCFVEYGLTCPSSCPTLSWPDVLAVFYAAHLVCADG